MLRTDAHDTLEGAPEVGDIVVAHLAGYVLDGMVARDEEDLGTEDAATDDVVGGRETRLEPEEADEGVLVQAGPGSNLVKRGYLGQVAVDAPERLADADVLDGGGGRMLIHEARQEHLEQSVDGHPAGGGKLPEGLDALHVLVGRVVGDGREVVQAEVRCHLHDVPHDLLHAGCRGNLQAVAVDMEVVVDVHGLVGEVEVVVAGGAGALHAVGEQGRDKVHASGLNLVTLIAADDVAAPFGDEEDAQEVAADVVVLAVGIEPGKTHIEQGEVEVHGLCVVWETYRITVCACRCATRDKDKHKIRTSHHNRTKFYHYITYPYHYIHIIAIFSQLFFGKCAFCISFAQTFPLQ